MYALLNDLTTGFDNLSEGKEKVWIYIFKIVVILLTPYLLILNPVIIAIANVFWYKKIALYDEDVEKIYGIKLTFWKFMAICYAYAGLCYRAVWTIW